MPDELVPSSRRRPALRGGRRDPTPSPEVIPPAHPVSSTEEVVIVSNNQIPQLHRQSKSKDCLSVIHTSSDDLLSFLFFFVYPDILIFGDVSDTHDSLFLRLRTDSHSNVYPHTHTRKHTDTRGNIRPPIRLSCPSVAVYSFSCFLSFHSPHSCRVMSSRFLLSPEHVLLETKTKGGDVEIQTQLLPDKPHRCLKYWK